MTDRTIPNPAEIPDHYDDGRPYEPDRNGYPNDRPAVLISARLLATALMLWGFWASSSPIREAVAPLPLQVVGLSAVFIAAFLGTVTLHEGVHKLAYRLGGYDAAIHPFAFPPYVEPEGDRYVRRLDAVYVLLSPLVVITVLSGAAAVAAPSLELAAAAAMVAGFNVYRSGRDVIDARAFYRYPRHTWIYFEPGEGLSRRIYTPEY